MASTSSFRQKLIFSFKIILERGCSILLGIGLSNLLPKYSMQSVAQGYKK